MKIPSSTRVTNEKASRHSGFTIVELLIVVVIIAVLATITLVAWRGAQKRASLAAAQSNSSTVVKQIQLFRIDNARYPTSILDCPSPASTNLCLKPGKGQTFSYFAFNPGTGARFGAALHSTSPPAYEIIVTDSAQFYYYSTAEISSTNEFVQYMDMAPIINRYGLQSYQISFDIKSASIATASSVYVYMQNGSGARYDFGWIGVPVTTSYQHQTINVTPALSNGALTQSILAFYGTYGTGNIATIKNLQMQLTP